MAETKDFPPDETLDYFPQMGPPGRGPGMGPGMGPGIPPGRGPGMPPGRGPGMGPGNMRPRSDIPEMVRLRVSPAACGRRFFLDSFLNHSNDKQASLYISEEDIISGCYEELIPKAVEELLRRKKPTPRAIAIAVTCVDHVLGTDHDALIRGLSGKFPDIKFCVCSEGHITEDHGKFPFVSTQLAMYGMLDKTDKRVDAVNLVGERGPETDGSELHSLIRRMGIEIRRMDGCRTFDEFLSMAESRLNLVVSPMGLIPAEQMEKELDIPYLYIPGSYSVDNISGNYKAIASFFGKELPGLSEYVSAARSEISETLSELKDKAIAVDGAADPRPATLARTLLEYGFNVRLLMQGPMSDDNDDTGWLKEHHPEVRILRERSPELMNLGDEYRGCVCIGFPGAQAIHAEHVVDFMGPGAGYGFQAVTNLMRKLREAVRTPAEYGRDIGRRGVRGI